MMKILALVAVLFVSVQARSEPHHVEIRHSDVKGMHRLVDVIEGAPAFPEGRIIAGNTAFRGQFPYQVALYLNGQSFCGGSLISSRWVLTAAHCASDIYLFVAYLGAQDLDASEFGRLVIMTSTKIVHSQFSSSTLINDIALLNLNQDVTLNPLMQPIKFASGNNTYAGSSGRVSGWGRTSQYGSVGGNLHYVDLPIITNSECAQTYGSKIVFSTICASGSNGRSTCNGDSGGPLVDPYTGQQIGIVSFVSNDGCTKGHPMGFARVTSFASWITTHTGIAAA